MKPLHPSSKRVILTVWCRHCSDDRLRGTRLGQVEAARSGVVLWVTAHPRLGRMEAAQRLSSADPAFPIDDVLPAELPAGCPRHGYGTVSRADITGRTGKLDLYLNGRRAAH